HEETQQLLDMLGRTAPKLVEDLVPKALSLSVVTKILQNLLTEHVPIRDFRTIAETLAEQSQRTQDPAALTASVRVALSRGIVQKLIGSSEEIPVAVLDPSLEQLLQRTLQASEEGQAGFEPGLAERLQNALSETSAAMEATGQEGVLLVAAPIRPWMARFAKHAAPGMHILSYNEIPDNRQIKVVTTIGNTANGD
ncbi:MAG: FHIPEP family type III secretion protein, partial [Candidatus Thiodiazotropha endolucinida]